jgi:hypothetical protein
MALDITGAEFGFGGGEQAHHLQPRLVAQGWSLHRYSSIQKARRRRFVGLQGSARPDRTSRRQRRRSQPGFAWRVEVDVNECSCPSLPPSSDALGGRARWPRDRAGSWRLQSSLRSRSPPCFRADPISGAFPCSRWKSSAKTRPATTPPNLPCATRAARGTRSGSFRAPNAAPRSRRSLRLRT